MGARYHWIEWREGVPPPPDGALVYVELASDRRRHGSPSLSRAAAERCKPRRAELYRWISSSEIVGYRIVEKPK